MRLLFGSEGLHGFDLGGATAGQGGRGDCGEGEAGELKVISGGELPGCRRLFDGRCRKRECQQLFYEA